MNQIELLKAAYAASTPDEWKVTRYNDLQYSIYNAGRPGYDEVYIDDTEDVANAEFIALAHNLMPMLLEAVEELGFMQAAFENMLLQFGDKMYPTDRVTRRKTLGRVQTLLTRIGEMK